MFVCAQINHGVSSAYEVSKEKHEESHAPRFHAQEHTGQIMRKHREKVFANL